MTATGGGVRANGVVLEASGPGRRPARHRVRRRRDGAGAFGVGLLVNAGTATVSNSQLIASASGGGGQAVGINVFASLRLQTSEVISTGTAGAASFGIPDQGSGNVLVSGPQLTGW